MKTIQVAAGIIWREGRFLAARRPEGKPRAGFWEFPGGKQEPNESIEETLRRELREELGIVCAAPVPWRTISHAYPEMTVVLHFMHVTEFSGEPAPQNPCACPGLTPHLRPRFPIWKQHYQMAPDAPAGFSSC